MYRLRQSQWEVLLMELEKSATGATIHDIRQKYSLTKDKVESYCNYLNGKQYLENYIDQWKDEATEQLRKYGYSDIKLFIEEVK